MDKIDIDPDGDVFLILNCEEGQFLDASSWPESVENPLCLLSGGVREVSLKWLACNITCSLLTHNYLGIKGTC